MRCLTPPCWDSRQIVPAAWVAQSTTDHVADPGSHDIVMREVSSRDLTERILENSYHVATLDNDAPVIFEESAEFVRRVTGP